MKKFKSISRKNHDRRGTTAVEFSLMFPIILTFFIAMIGMTQALLLNDTAQHAAYEGARQGMVVTSDSQSIKNAVADFTKSMGLKNAEVAIQPAIVNSSTKELTVAVSIPLKSNAWVKVPFLPDNWSVNSSVTLARQNGED